MPLLSRWRRGRATRMRPPLLPPRGHGRRRLGVAALHALVGGALLLAPGQVLRGAGDPAGRQARLAARVLGARHLGQAALLAAVGGRVAARLGAAVDGLHGASMIALGLAVRRHRSAALASAAAAAALAAFELREAADHSPLTVFEQRKQDRYGQARIAPGSTK